MIDLYSDRWEFAMSQNPDFEETSLFDLFPVEEKKTDKKKQKNEKHLPDRKRHWEKISFNCY